MFAELVCIALAVCLLFCESVKGRLADAMSFETLLEMVVIENTVIRISLAKRKSQARAKSACQASFHGVTMVFP